MISQHQLSTVPTLDIVLLYEEDAIPIQINPSVSESYGSIDRHGVQSGRIRHTCYPHLMYFQCVGIGVSVSVGVSVSTATPLGA